MSVNICVHACMYIYPYKYIHMRVYVCVHTSPPKNRCYAAKKGNPQLCWPHDTQQVWARESIDSEPFPFRCTTSAARTGTNQWFSAFGWWNAHHSDPFWTARNHYLVGHSSWPFIIYISGPFLTNINHQSIITFPLIQPSLTSWLLPITTHDSPFV